MAAFQPPLYGRFWVSTEEHRGRVYPRVPVTLCTSYACPTMSETLIQRFRNWHKLSVVAPVAYPARAPQRAWVLMNRGQAQARRG